MSGNGERVSINNQRAFKIDFETVFSPSPASTK